jgi:hypothetical protein
MVVYQFLLPSTITLGGVLPSGKKRHLLKQKQ